MQQLIEAFIIILDVHCHVSEGCTCSGYISSICGEIALFIQRIHECATGNVPLAKIEQHYNNCNTVRLSFARVEHDDAVYWANAKNH